MNTQLHPKHAEWIETRKLDLSLALALGLFTKSEGGKLWISVPYIENGVTVNHKYRMATEKRHMMDAGAPLILWNHDVLLEDKVQAGQQAVVICEGEWDAIAAIQSGYPQTVSVPNGGPDSETAVAENPDDDAARYRFIWRSRALLDNVGCFVLAVDDDAVGRALRADLARRLGPERCRFVVYPDECKDLNEVLRLHGEGEVARCLGQAKPYPIKGIYRFSDFPEPPEINPVSIGLPVRDDCYKLVVGTLTVWTGFAGAGKTSFLMFLIANLLRNGLHIAMGSFETAVKPILFNKLVEAISRSTMMNVEPAKRAMAEELLQKRFTIIAQDSDDPSHELTLDETLELARVSVVRDGVQLLIIDPWNEIEHKRRPDEGEHEYTSRAIRAWKAFAKTYRCAVWIVAHPRKPAEFGKSGSAPGLYDVSGSAHWANKADYGVIIHRPNKQSNVVEVTISKVRMGLPGYERTVKLAWSWLTASYDDAGGNHEE